MNKLERMLEVVSAMKKKGGRGNRVRVVGASLTEKVSVNKDS